MRRSRLSLPKISLAFAAGCVGGLANAFFVWLFGAIGLTAALGVKLAPAFSPPFLYQKLVWGGIWGWLFLLPPNRLSYPARGLLFSFAPVLVQLLVVFPFKVQKGLMGLELGYLIPAFVVFYNLVWGLTTAWWLWLTEHR